MNNVNASRKSSPYGPLSCDQKWYPNFPNLPRIEILCIANCNFLKFQQANGNQTAVFSEITAAGLNSALWLQPKAALRIIHIDSTPGRAFRRSRISGTLLMNYSNMRKKDKVT
jgi:hypothetical protein